MKRLLLVAMFLTVIIPSCAQTNNPVSLYEGAIIHSVEFDFSNSSADTILMNAYAKVVESEFRITPQSQFNSFLASYYVSKLSLLPFVVSATMGVAPTSQNEVVVTVRVVFSDEQTAVKQRNAASLPVLYNSERTFLTLKVAASEMAYSNNNAWFAQPKAMTEGNPLAEQPVGEGYTAWLEGFGSAGVYGIVKVIPQINLHIYGGANYLVAFSAGNELFTRKARISGAVEEAFVGLIGGGRTAQGYVYKYNATYGRKQFTLGDGWLIVNTSMNGHDRAALQLNPRWAGKSLLQAGVVWNRIFVQAFRLKPNELDILNSRTVLNGVNVELRNRKNGLLSLTFLQVPKSNFRYYMFDGATHTRDGLQVFALRIARSTGQGGGLFYKAEAGYQRNTHFKMSAWAGYGELGWNFKKTRGTPTVSYRFAYFSGDDPDSQSYNRWDALYTGGNGEQWVQGSNMYKIVQNSNEVSHRIQGVYTPLPKIQLVGQFWLFYAAQKNNIGGNPALTTLQSRSYGTEYNLTVKYFHSRSWYFHLNTAYTVPGRAIRANISHTQAWFCLSFFARYSF
ncbi:MAG: alginate export family protein [Alistipes sp.]